MKNKMCKFIEKDLNDQYQTSIKVENILNDLNIDLANEQLLTYYKKRGNNYFRLVKLAFVTCLILIVSTVCIFTVKQKQIMKMLHDKETLLQSIQRNKYDLTDEEFERLKNENNRLWREPIFSFQYLDNVCIYIYYGKNGIISDYFILVDFIEVSSEPVRIFVNNQEVISTNTRFVDCVLQIDLTVEDIIDCLDFVVKYKNNSQRYVVFRPIEE